MTTALWGRPGYEITGPSLSLSRAAAEAGGAKPTGSSGPTRTTGDAEAAARGIVLGLLIVCEDGIKRRVRFAVDRRKLAAQGAGRRRQRIDGRCVVLFYGIRQRLAVALPTLLYGLTGREGIAKDCRGLGLLIVGENSVGWPACPPAARSWFAGRVAFRRRVLVRKCSLPPGRPQ
jgi:hypothetical protein